MHPKLRVEQLEARLLLATTPELVLGTELPANEISTTRISDTGYFSRSDAFGFELWKTDGTQAGTYRVKDINPSGSSYPAGFFRLGDEVFFSANDGVHGRELWKTDGTAAGTVLVKDITPGAVDTDFGNGSAGPRFTRLNDRLLFSADDGEHGPEAWATDGTSPGTEMLGEFSQANYVFQPWVVGEVAVFRVRSQDYSTDGTAAGTIPIEGDAFVEAGVGFTHSYTDHEGMHWIGDGTREHLARFGNGQLSNFVPGFVMDDILYYQSGRDLWRSDGTEAGTFQIERGGGLPNPELVRDAEYVEFENDLYFAGDDGQLGTELWKVETDSGIFELVRDIQVGQSSSQVEDIVVLNSQMYFIASDGAHGRELWKSDGTSAGTQLVEDLAPGAADSVFGDLVPLESRGILSFFANEFGNNFAVDGWQLWSSDGSSAGTNPIAPLKPLDGRIEVLTGIEDSVLFVGTDIDGDRRLFRSDGTNSGTIPLTHTKGGWRTWQANFSVGVGTHHHLAIDGNIYFTGEILDSAGQATSHLLVSDGSLAGTRSLLEYEGFAQGFMELNGKLLFFNSTVGSRLWISDGTAEGTFELGLPRYNRAALQVADGRALVFLQLNNLVSELWSTDGTQAGTFKLRQFTGGQGPLTTMGFLNGNWYFSANEGQNGWELWQSDGTTEGTRLVKDINASQGSSPTIQGETQNTLFFNASSGQEHQLWRTDGTENGTFALGNLRTQPLAVVNNIFYFKGDDGIHGEELWRTDGTVQGTYMVKDIHPVAGVGSSIEFINVLGNEIFFAAYDGPDGLRGYELWKSDGTEAGTDLVRDLDASTRNSFSSSTIDSVVWNDEVYFVTNAQTSSGRGDLWKSDGTHAGTTLVSGTDQDISWPRSQLTVIGDALYYTAKVRDERFLLAIDEASGATQVVMPISAGTSLLSDDMSAFMLMPEAELWAWQRNEAIVDIPAGGGTVNIDVEAGQAVVRLNNSIVFSGNYNRLGKLTVRGSSAPDTFLIHANPGEAQRLRDIVVIGDSQDTLQILGGTAQNVDYLLQDHESTIVEIDRLRLKLQQIDTVIDELAADYRRFELTRGDDVATLRQGDQPDDGISLLTVNDRRIEFPNPELELTIDASDGNDSIEIQALDTTFAGKVAVSRAFANAPTDTVLSDVAWKASRQVTVLGNYFLESRLGAANLQVPIHDFVYHNPSSATSWHNQLRPGDVDGDGFTVPLDALLVVNAINNGETLSGSLPNTSNPRLLDTSGDNNLSPIDALIVINLLNQEDGMGEGEEVEQEIAGTQAIFSHFSIPFLGEFGWRPDDLKGRRRSS